MDGGVGVGDGGGLDGRREGEVGEGGRGGICLPPHVEKISDRLCLYQRILR